MAKLSEQDFENKCIEVMESIITVNKEMSRLDAVNLAKKMLAKAEENGNEEVIKVFEKVVEEFEDATDDEYNTLKKQLL